MQKRILWVDDEIDLLKPHTVLLQQKGYRVDTATNGKDAVEMVKKSSYDLVFLDEMMPGIGGLQTLGLLKEIAPSLPVVMVTKNEAESLMEEAIGSKISYYLTKPVNPSQILLTCKKFLDGKKIERETVSRDYLQEFHAISAKLSEGLDHEEWVDLHLKLSQRESELDAHPEIGLRQTLLDQKREANAEFAKFIEKNYHTWLEPKGNGPALSTNIVERFVMPELEKNSTVFFFVVDCLRYDQWLVMERALSEYFTLDKSFYYSILPTATPYSRNSLFSGMFPADLEARFPHVWESDNEDENSRNAHEHELLKDLLERKRIKLKSDCKYIKIIDTEFGRQIEQNILSYLNSKLIAIVVNFIDMMAHGRSDLPILKEIAPDEAAYRSLTASWFRHSSMFSMLKTLSKQKNVTIVLTTDHGSVRCMRGAKVIGDREASTNLRYKFGRNLKVDERHAVFIKRPGDYRLPKHSLTTNYIIAKEDYYFVYPTDYHKYLNQYRDSFQHGGISMEEMILPVVTMRPRA